MVKEFPNRLDAEKEKRRLRRLGWHNLAVVPFPQGPPPSKVHYALRAGTQWLMRDGQMRG